VPSPDPIRLAIPKSLCAAGAGKERSSDTALSIFKHLHTRLAPFKRIRRIDLSPNCRRRFGKNPRVQLRRSNTTMTAATRCAGRVREDDFPNLPKGAAAGSVEELMNEVWKKPADLAESLSGHGRQGVGVSSWHLVDQPRIDVYADVIEDHQFSHIDPERATRNAVRHHVAHGFLTMSLMKHHVLRGDAGDRGHHRWGSITVSTTALPLTGTRGLARAGVHFDGSALAQATELLSRTASSVEIEGETKPALPPTGSDLIYFA